MSIAHVTYTSLPKVIAGKEIVVDNLIRAQLALGHEAVLVTRLKQWLSYRSLNPQYSALPLPPKRNDPSDYMNGVGQRWPVALAATLYQFIKRFDVWHIHGVYPAGWQFLPALRLFRVPVVLTAHGPDVEVMPEIQHGYRLYPKHEPRVREAVANADLLTAISDSVKAEYLALGAPPERIVSIPNGVDYHRIADRVVDSKVIRAELGWPMDKTVIITVGRNHPKKGYRYIPDTIRALQTQLPEFLWVIVGADLEPIEALANTAGVSSYLRTYPPIGGGEGGEQRFPPNRLVDLLKAADVFAFPSEMETFGLVAIEAMAAGLPVVTTNVQGLRDVVIDGLNGILCPARDHAAMAQAIASVVENKSLRSRLREQGLKHAASFDWELVAQRYLVAYKELTQK